MDDRLFNFKVEKLNKQDIRIEGEIISESSMNMSTRMFIHIDTIADFIISLKEITPELIADDTHKPIKNEYDDIGFAIESYEKGDLLTIASNHIKEDGTVDNYGLLDIPYIFRGRANKIYIDLICDQLSRLLWATS